VDGIVTDDPVRHWLDVYDAEGEERWRRLEAWLRGRFERDITIEATLFLIGVQLRGRGFEPKIHRDRKQDVIMDGTFCAFEALGFYQRVGMEEDGAWIWERLLDIPAELTVEDQERLLKMGVLEYFSTENVLT
jgi:hypothetical protein